ncbi:MAG: MFS transporter [Caldilineaceae bacterium]|nr:MFS transporter [Caldilineaceae bacterium]
MPSRSSVFTIFTAAYFLSYFFRSANAVIAPDLALELGLSAAELGLMTSLFFAAFAAVQIPLGMALDRYGPRYVTPLLMLAGAVGSMLFAGARGFPELAFGRALIGVGMAGILMGALKAFSQWFPPHRYSTLSGLLVGLGSAGALAAATPLAVLNEVTGWRWVFVVGAIAIVGVGLAIVAGTRNTPPGQSWPVAKIDLGALRTVFGDLRFWRIALLVFFTNGTLLAFQGLWAGPYLNDVLQVDAIVRGNVLLALSLGVTAGFLTSGWLADRVGLPQTVIGGTFVFVVAQLALALHPPLWVVVAASLFFGISGGWTIMLLAQPRLVFPLAITGQATTATNVFAIGGTFVIQWLMGLIIGAFPADSLGRYPAWAYLAALLCTASGTLVMLLWYLPMWRAGSSGE